MANWAIFRPLFHILNKTWFVSALFRLNHANANKIRGEPCRIPQNVRLYTVIDTCVCAEVVSLHV